MIACAIIDIYLVCAAPNIRKIIRNDTGGETLLIDWRDGADLVQTRPPVGRRPGRAQGPGAG
jgi:hypothetical protein